MKSVTLNLRGGGVFSHLFALLNNIAVLIRDGHLVEGDEIYVEGRKEDHLIGIAPFNFLDLILEQAPNDGEVIGCGSGHPVDYVDVLRDMAWFKRASALLTFNSEPMRLANEFFDVHINTENTLGVHIRMTDMNTAHPWLGLVLIEDYYAQIDKALAENPNINKIFVASDNREDARKIVARYGGMVVWRDSAYIMENSNDDHQEICKQESYIKNNPTYTNDPVFYVDCIVDALILMKSKYLIGRTSTLNWFVQCCHLSNFDKYYHVKGSNDIQMDTILWFGPWKGYTITDIINKKDFDYMRNYMQRHFKLPKEAMERL